MTVGETMMPKAGLKWVQVCIALCLLLTGRAQDDPLSQRVTYDQPAQTVKQLLESLSRQTGVRLFAPSPIDAEIVLVSVREMPLKELMDHLATVTDGEWFRQPNGSYHLVRTPKITRERRQQDDAQILQGLQRALKRKEIRQLLEPLTEQRARQHRDKIKELMREVGAQDINQPLWRTPYARSIYEQLELLLAGKRLVARLIQRMDLRQLLEIPVGERRVFSNVRGRFLLPLGFDVQSLLRQYVQEDQLVHQVWTHPTEGLDAQQVQQFNSRYGYVIYDEWLRRKPMRKPPTRVYLVVHRQAPDAFSCSVALATDDLKESRSDDGTSLYLWAQSEEEAEEEEKRESSDKAEEQPAAEEASQPPLKVEWSERSRQFIEAYRTMEQSTEPVPWPSILDPSQTEPLSLIPSDVLRTYARQRGKSLIALLPDNLTWWIYSALREKQVLQHYIDVIDYYASVHEDEKVILFKPLFFSYLWGQRVDRVALMRWIERVRQRGYVQMEDCLILSKSLAGQYGLNELGDLYLSLISNDLWWVDYSILELRFLASLTAAQIAQLRAGQSLTLASLTAAQREQLVRALYFSELQLSISIDQSLSEGEDLLLDYVEPVNQIDLVHAHYPDGLPADLTIQLADRLSSFAQENIGVFTQRKAGVWSDFRSVSSLAGELHMVQNPPSDIQIDESVLQYYRSRAERYQSLPLMPAKRKLFEIDVRLSQNHTVSLLIRGADSLADYELLNEGKPATLDNLPKELKQQLEEELKTYARWHKQQEE